MVTITVHIIIFIVIIVTTITIVVNMIFNIYYLPQGLQKQSIQAAIFQIIILVLWKYNLWKSGKIHSHNGTNW